MSLVRLHRTVGVKVGPVQIGGGAPIAVQSMTMTDTADARATAEQCLALAGVERGECLSRNRQRVGRGFFGELRAGAAETDEQPPAVFGIGAGLGEAARGETIVL